MFIDMSKAPETAEAYQPGTNHQHEGWYRRNASGDVEWWEVDSNGKERWTWMGGRKSFPVGHVPLPETVFLGHKQADSMDGLPPIGAVCEWAGCTFAPEDPKEPDLHVGDQVKIIAHFKDGEFDLAAFTFNPKIHNPDRGTAWVSQGACGCFRPIRTPEQIAAEERKKAIDRMAADCPHPMAPAMRDSVFAELYDAGYRKFEIVDGE